MGLILLQSRARPRAPNEVSAITMEDILRKLAVSRIDLLKLDIEGSERELFSTDSGAWLNRVEYIVVELHDRYRPGCAKAFYSALATRDFIQEIRGENIFIRLIQPKLRFQILSQGRSDQALR